VWGDWALFQRLLTVLRRIGDRHGGASIANIAVRWVLDHPFVGAVLVGTSTPFTFTCSSSSHLMCATDGWGGFSPSLLFFSFSKTRQNLLDPPPGDAMLLFKGTRLGVSEHPEDNLNVFRFHLSDADRADIEAVLERSNGRKMITLIGDCGAEYR
jgi:hypothetical protein